MDIVRKINDLFRRKSNFQNILICLTVIILLCFLWVTYRSTLMEGNKKGRGTKKKKKKKKKNKKKSKKKKKKKKKKKSKKKKNKKNKKKKSKVAPPRSAALSQMSASPLPPPGGGGDDNVSVVGGGGLLGGAGAAAKPISGCMQKHAQNYQPFATVSDGSCLCEEKDGVYLLDDEGRCRSPDTETVQKELVGRASAGGEDLTYDSDGTPDYVPTGMLSSSYDQRRRRWGDGGGGDIGGPTSVGGSDPTYAGGGGNGGGGVDSRVPPSPASMPAFPPTYGGGGNNRDTGEVPPPVDPTRQKDWRPAGTLGFRD